MTKDIIQRIEVIQNTNTQNQNDQLQNIQNEQHKGRKRVHWSQEAEKKLQKYTSKRIKTTKNQNISEADYKLGENKWMEFADKRDSHEIFEYCKKIVADSERINRIKNKYGEESKEAKQAEKKKISALLSEFDHIMLRKACVKRDIRFIEFLVDNFTEYHLKINFMYRNYGAFDVYLMGCFSSYQLKNYKKEDFIKGIKIFLKVADTVAGALNHYIERMTDNYEATEEMREDFIIALKEAKEEGIIRNIDSDEIQAIQDSYKGKENMTNFSFVDKLRDERNNQNSLVSVS